MMLVTKNGSVDLGLLKPTKKNFYKYSANLHRFLVRAARREFQGQMVAGFVDQEGRHHIGYLFDDEVQGTRIQPEVLCDGREGRGVVVYCFARRLTEVPEFWTDYLARGRCLFDPEHRAEFANGAERYDVSGDRRTCRWCGLVQQKHSSPRHDNGGATDMVAALKEVRKILSMCSTRTFAAPEDAEVAAMCERLGFGAVIGAASKTWADKLRAMGLQGGQLTSGPCESTVKSALAKIDAALAGVSTPPKEVAPVSAVAAVDTAWKGDRRSARATMAYEDTARRLADAATPGRWRACKCGKCGLVWAVDQDAVVINASLTVDDVPAVSESTDNARLIAAHDPETVRALADVVVAARDAAMLGHTVGCLAMAQHTINKGCTCHVAAIETALNHLDSVTTEAELDVDGANTPAVT